MNELARALEQSAAPGLTLLASKVKCLLFANASVPNQGGSTTAPRSSAHILPDLGPDSKSQKDQNNGVPKKVQSPGLQIQIPSRHSCPRAHKKLYIHIGLHISATGNFHKAVNDLRDKARRAFYAIKGNIKFDIPIRIWLILESDIEPIALYEVWGPLTNQEFTKMG
jgi:hypothetical protein